MPLLYYWKRENRLGDMVARDWFHLSQRSPAMHRVAPGESLWAFTRDQRGAYKLAAELVVSATTLNSPDWAQRYGRYRVWGDARRSAYFDVESSPVAEAEIRRLSLAPRTDPLGRSFQGPGAVRGLTEADHVALAAFAAGLPLDVRVHPEGRRDVALRLLRQELVEELELPAAPVAAEGPVRWTGVATGFVRDRALVLALRQRYRDRCQLCEWSPRPRYDAEVCEGHHLQWLSQGGWDGRDNLVLLCPNHHRLVHACAAPFDFADLSFRFGDRREPLRLNEHLRAAG